MTTLTKDEIIALADEALVDPLCGVYMTTIDELERFAHLCRADLVAENEALQLRVKMQSKPMLDALELFAERDALRAEVDKLKGEQTVLIRLFREGLNVLETLVGESTDEQESLDALTEKMNNAINDVEYRHE